MNRMVSLIRSSVLAVALTGCTGLGLGGELTADENGADVALKFHIRGDGLVTETVDSYAAISAGTSASASLAGQIDLTRVVGDTLAALPADADVVFTVDTTGSMVWAIDSVSEAVEDAMLVAPDRHYGVVVYRDLGDTYVSEIMGPLGPDTQAAVSAARAMEADGGGDFPEHVAAGLDTALRESAWRDGKERHIILIGDAPDHGHPEDPTLDSVLALGNELGVRIHTVAIACGLACKEEIDLL